MLPETASAVTSGVGPQETSTNESEPDIPGKILRTIAHQRLTLCNRVTSLFIHLFAFHFSNFKCLGKSVFPEELTELIEELQEYTEEVMKIEMAPWVQNYTVPMEELYTELTLAQIENKPTGPIPVQLNNYTQLFTTQEATDQQETSNIQQNLSTHTRKGKRRRGKKILAKGDPGMGKSTLGRKIAYDWAKGVFTAVSVVFFVSMKLIRPGQTIENIIIEQVPPLEALEIGERKLKNVLDTFGHKCLIILDGLDEHDLGTNDDVKKVIEGRKLLRCNIFLTSRPHSTEEIERHFSTHVIVRGFSGIRAKQFLSNCLHNSGKVQTALSFSVRNSLSQSSPMLLLFLSILVNTNELDLARDYVCLSEMYFRLVRCVYRKYCERIKLEFQESKFVDVLKRVGKVAWKMWKSGKGWAKKSEILKEVGEDAFEIGLLIGHRDYRLSRDETADILITFPHQTILEFLGSYGFLHILNEGDSIESLFDNEQERYKVMQYLSFLQFCLSFLEGSCGGEKLKFRKSVYESIVTHCAKEINFEQMDMLDMGKLLPVFKVPFIHSDKNRPLLKFLQAILSKCDKTREFYLHSVSYYPSQLFSLLVPSLPPVSLEFEKSTQGKSVTILDKASNYGALRKVLDNCDAAGLKICLFLLCDIDIDVSKVLHRSLEKLYLCGHPQIMPLVTVGGDLSSYPFLKELSVFNVRVHSHVFYILHEAMKSEKLPSLSHLHFEGFVIIKLRSVNARQVGLEILQLLFSPLWTRLTHFTLDFRKAFITMDTETFRGFFEERINWFPRLSSLTLHSREGLCLPLKSMFQIRQPTIKSLKLHNVSEEDYEAICSVVNDGNLPCLVDLNLSMRESNVQISDSEDTDDTVKEKSARSLSVLSFSILAHLTLKGFVRSLADLNTVALSAKGSSVSYLDISHSQGITGVLSDFLSHRFPHLGTLILSNCGLNHDGLDSLTKPSVEGRLPELKHLDLSDNEAIRGQWQHLFSHGHQ